MGNWDFEDVQDKLNHPKQNDDESEINVDLSDIEDDAEEDVDEDVDEEQEDKEDVLEEDKKNKQDSLETKEQKPGPSDETKQAIYDDVISRVGSDTILKIRGKQYKISDLSPDEVVTLLQKSKDVDQRYQELATSRKELEMNRSLVEKGARAVQQFLDEQETNKGRKDFSSSIPSILKPGEDDTEETKALKQYIVQQSEELSAIKQHVTQNVENSTQKKMIDEILGMREDYPMASMDEVLAVKSVRPDINSEELVRASHNYYSSPDFIKKAFKSNPTVKREYDQEVIRNYIASQKKAKALPGKRQGATRVEKVMGSSEKPSGLFDFDKAGELARKYLKEVRRSEEEA